MAQLDYFGTWNDSWTILQDIFARGDIRAYFDAGPHDQPLVEPYTSLTKELKEKLMGRPRVFLFGSFSTYPPLFDFQPTGPEVGKYFLRDSGGGPGVSFDLAAQVEGRLASGMLSTQPRYELEPGCWEPPNSALKAAYVDISKRMKKHLTRYKGRIWIGPEALNLLESGQAQLPGALRTLPSDQRPAA